MLTYSNLWTTELRPFQTVEEETVTIRAARAGDENATLALLLAYRPLMNAVIREYTPEMRAGERSTVADLEDLRSQAILGMLAAIREWKEEENPSLAGIARGRVRFYVAQSAGSSVSASVPDRTMSRFFGIARRAGYDKAEGMRIAPQYDMDASTFARIFDLAWVDTLDTVATPDSDDVPSAQRTVGSGSTVSHHWAADAPAGSLWDDAEGAYAQVENRSLVQTAFKAVNDQEAAVCALAYGFVDYDPVPDAEIAHRLGLSSRLKALRVRKAALAKMRDALGL